MKSREDLMFFRELMFIEHEKELEYLQDMEEWEEQQRKEYILMVEYDRNKDKQQSLSGTTQEGV